MESVYKKSNKTQHLYKLQEFTLFYNYKRVEIIIIIMVFAFKIIQIHNIPYFKEKNNRKDILNSSYNYLITKKIFYYCIFKINKNKLLLANKYKLNIIIHIIDIKQ